MKLNKLTTLLLPLVTILPLINPSLAAVPKPPPTNNQALQKAQGMMRQLGEEKAALEAEKTGLQEQLQKLEAQVKQLTPLQAEVQRYQAHAETLRGNNNTLSSQLTAAQQKQQALHKKLQEIVAQAKQIKADNQILVSAVKEREQWISQCHSINDRLVTANRELAEKCQDKGFWHQVAQLEPFTGLANIETQNTVETYQFKLEDLKVTDFASQDDGASRLAN